MFKPLLMITALGFAAPALAHQPDKKTDEAVGSTAGSLAGATVGTTLGGPVGTVVGSTVGGAVGSTAGRAVHAVIPHKHKKPTTSELASKDAAYRAPHADVPTQGPRTPEPAEEAKDVESDRLPSALPAGPPAREPQRAERPQPGPGEPDEPKAAPPSHDATPEPSPPDRPSGPGQAAA